MDGLGDSASVTGPASQVRMEDSEEAQRLQDAKRQLATVVSKVEALIPSVLGHTADVA